MTTQTRFSAIASGQADMECGASSVTLARMKEVAFSTLTFLDGTGLLIRASTTGNSLKDLSGKKIGVIAGTSNERALNEALKASVLSATVVKVTSREEGLAQLEAGALDAFASDRVLLLGLVMKARTRRRCPARRCCPSSLRDRSAARRLGDEAGGRRGACADYRSGALHEVYNTLVRRARRAGPVLERCSAGPPAE